MARGKGWYEDPSTAGRFRWWDGQGWTRMVSTRRGAPAPAESGEHVVPDPTTLDRVARIVWPVLASLLVLTIALAAAGMRVNQRELRAQPSVVLTSRAADTELVRVTRDRAEGRVLDIGGAAQVIMPAGFADPRPGDQDEDGLWRYVHSSVALDTGRDGSAESTVWAGTGLSGLFDRVYRDANAGVPAVEMARRHYGGDAVVGSPSVVEERYHGHLAWWAEVPVTYRGRHLVVRALAAELSTAEWVLVVHTPAVDETPQQTAAATQALRSVTFRD